MVLAVTLITSDLAVPYCVGVYGDECEGSRCTGLSCLGAAFKFLPLSCMGVSLGQSNWWIPSLENNPHPKRLVPTC